MCKNIDQGHEVELTDSDYDQNTTLKSSTDDINYDYENENKSLEILEIRNDIQQHRTTVKITSSFIFAFVLLCFTVTIVVCIYFVYKRR